MSDNKNINKKRTHSDLNNSQSQEQNHNNDNLENKKIKSEENGNSFTPKQILQNYKQMKSELENLQVEKLQDYDIQEIKETLEQTQKKLDSIQNEIKKNNTFSLLKNGGLSEQQFIDIFKKSLEKKIITNYEDQGRSQMEKNYNFQYTSYLLPNNSIINFESSMVEYGYFCQQEAWNVDEEEGQKFIEYVDENGTTMKLLNYEVKNGKLSEEIKLPTYNKNFIHIQNLNSLVKVVLGIQPDLYKNMNMEVLFQEFTKLLYSLSDDEDYFLDRIESI